MEVQLVKSTLLWPRNKAAKLLHLYNQPNPNDRIEQNGPFDSSQNKQVHSGPNGMEYSIIAGMDHCPFVDANKKYAYNKVGTCIKDKPNSDCSLRCGC